MKLFVTQLQYQDPMNPMESAEMASQVAQFNMVDLMYKNNTAMEGMASALNTSASVSAVSLLGHGVEYQGSELYIDEDGPRPFYIQGPDEGIAGGRVTIRDASGRAVKSIDLGAAEPGSRTKLDWDGTDSQGNELPEGTYHVSIEAQDLNGNDTDIQTHTTGIVTGIDNSQDGLPRILIKDGPILNFNEIKSVQG
jgi:flagellar basal-body rod modification protein FlgD